METTRSSGSSSGRGDGAELAEYRRKKRNETTYRYQKAHRKALKEELVRARGGRCADCGFAGAPAAFDLHHRDPREKEFAVSTFNGSLKRFLAEAQKCDLLCANCHRLRHAAEDALIRPHPVVAWRRRNKMRAVEFMGGRCASCGCGGASVLFDFHHVDATSKDFGISQDGIPRSWEKIVAELAKCVMLCANCHREVHAGVRVVPPRVSEDALPYAA